MLIERQVPVVETHRFALCDRCLTELGYTRAPWRTDSDEAAQIFEDFKRRGATGDVILVMAVEAIGANLNDDLPKPRYTVLCRKCATALRGFLEPSQPDART